MSALQDWIVAGGSNAAVALTLFGPDAWRAWRGRGLLCCPDCHEKPRKTRHEFRYVRCGCRRRAWWPLLYPNLGAKDAWNLSVLHELAARAFRRRGLAERISFELRVIDRMSPSLREVIAGLDLLGRQSRESRLSLARFQRRLSALLRSERP